MKRLFLFLFLLTPLVGHAQLANTNVSNGSGAPVGACASGSIYTDSGTGSIYACVSSVWTSISIPGSLTISGPIPYTDVKAHGVKGDVRTANDGVVNSNTTFTSGTGAFTAADTGKVLICVNCLTSSTPLVVTVTFVNSTTLTLGSTAGVTGGGKTWYLGTDDTSAINAVFAAIPSSGSAVSGGGTIFFPCGAYLIRNTLQLNAEGGWEVVGQGTSGWGNSNLQCARIVTASQIIMLQLGDGTSTRQGGGIIKNMTFTDIGGAAAGSAEGGLFINAVSRVKVEDDEFDNFLSFQSSGAITSVVEASTTVTVTTTGALPSTFVTGLPVTLAGFTPAGYNGNGVVITVTGANTFTYQAGAGLGAVGVIGTITRPAFGILVGGAQGLYQNHNLIINPKMRKVAVGIDIVGPSDGPDIYGGDIVVDDVNSTTAHPSIGIYIPDPTGTSAVKVSNTSIDVSGQGAVGIRVENSTNSFSNIKVECQPSTATCHTNANIGYWFTTNPATCCGTVKANLNTITGGSAARFDKVVLADATTANTNVYGLETDSGSTSDINDNSANGIFSGIISNNRAISCRGTCRLGVNPTAVYPAADLDIDGKYQVNASGQVSMVNSVATVLTGGTNEVGGGVPAVLYKLTDVADRTSSQGAVTMYTTASTGAPYNLGLYTVHAVIFCNAGVAGTTVGLTITYRGGVAVANIIPNTSPCVTSNTQLESTLNIYSGSAQAIQWSTTYAGTGGYRVEIDLEGH